jgi:hypothetical protein
LSFLPCCFSGPFSHTGWPFGSGNLIAIPISLSLVLRSAGRQLNLDERDNDYINRAITAGVAGMLLVSAYLSFTAIHHSECTQFFPDGQGGRDCVGDYVIKVGPDFGDAFMYVLFAATAFWFAIARRSD